MDPAIATFQSVILSALWQVVSPLIGLLILNALIGIVYLARQSQIVKTHTDLHREHKERLKEHDTKLAEHDTDIAVIRAGCPGFKRAKETTASV